MVTLVREADEVARRVVRRLWFFSAPEARPEAGFFGFFGALRLVLHLVGAAFVVLFFESKARFVEADAEDAPCLAVVALDGECRFAARRGQLGAHASGSSIACAAVLLAKVVLSTQFGRNEERDAPRHFQLQFGVVVVGLAPAEALRVFAVGVAHRFFFGLAIDDGHAGFVAFVREANAVAVAGAAVVGEFDDAVE